VAPAIGARVLPRRIAARPGTIAVKAIRAANPKVVNATNKAVTAAARVAAFAAKAFKDPVRKAANTTSSNVLKAAVRVVAIAAKVCKVASATSKAVWKAGIKAAITAARDNEAPTDKIGMRAVPKAAITGNRAMRAVVQIIEAGMSRVTLRANPEATIAVRNRRDAIKAVTIMRAAIIAGRVSRAADPMRSGTKPAVIKVNRVAASASRATINRGITTRAKILRIMMMKAIFAVKADSPPSMVTRTGMTVVVSKATQTITRILIHVHVVRMNGIMPIPAGNA